MPSLPQTGALPIALLAITSIAATWYTLVLQHVPEPYLDEFFHVSQAQKYCKSDYTWDPKITTPPGLYLISLLLEPLIGSQCDTSSLRLVNVGAICMVCLAAYDILQNLPSPTFSNRKAQEDQSQNKKRPDGNDQTSLSDAHAALNISLFPPLFFFSGLYYTDVVSTLLVLLSYSAFLRKKRGNRKPRDEIVTLLVGAAALLFRQTNIFWVAVFPAGLAVIDTLRQHGTVQSNTERSSIAEVLHQSWREGRVYDRSVHDAGFQDYALVLLSVALTALKMPLLLIKTIAPYLILLALFGGFVAWNGGVVLGDKSAHVATIHSPQMLYYWPYIFFFSFPTLLPLLLGPIIHYLPEGRLKSSCQSNLTGSFKMSPPGIISIIVFLTSGLVAVRYNTIVHPYTLADNRHYVFYVFRILLRHPAIKYLAVPFYYISAWIAIQILGLGSQDEARGDQKNKKGQPTSNETYRQPCQASFILVWLATTALSVVSAPLVEPRYFIIPWIIWRIHIPYLPASLLHRSTRKASYDMRLVLETAWLLAINVATDYVFLYRGFSWPSEPGKVQRFLW